MTFEILGSQTMPLDIAVSLQGRLSWSSAKTTKLLRGIGVSMLDFHNQDHIAFGYWTLESSQGGREVPI